MRSVSHYSNNVVYIALSRKQVPLYGDRAETDEKKTTKRVVTLYRHESCLGIHGRRIFPVVSWRFFSRFSTPDDTRYNSPRPISAGSYVGIHTRSPLFLIRVVTHVPMGVGRDASGAVPEYPFQAKAETFDLVIPFVPHLVSMI